MKKPEKHTFEPVYSYTDIIDYIEDKYKIKTRGYKPNKNKEYRDFWHYVMENNCNNVSNGCFMYLPLSLERDDEDGKYWWATEITDLIKKEFSSDIVDDYLKVWVEW